MNTIAAIAAIIAAFGVLVYMHKILKRTGAIR